MDARNCKLVPLVASSVATLSEFALSTRGFEVTPSALVALAFAFAPGRLEAFDTAGLSVRGSAIDALPGVMDALRSCTRLRAIGLPWLPNPQRLGRLVAQCPALSIVRGTVVPFDGYQERALPPGFLLKVAQAAFGISLHFAVLLRRRYRLSACPALTAMTFLPSARVLAPWRRSIFARPVWLISHCTNSLPRHLRHYDTFASLFQTTCCPGT